MAYRLIGAKPLSEPMLLVFTTGTNFSEVLTEINAFPFKKNAFENVVCIIGGHFVSVSMC